MLVYKNHKHGIVFMSFQDYIWIAIIELFLFDSYAQGSRKLSWTKCLHLVVLTCYCFVLVNAVADVKKVIDKTSPRQIGAAIENLLKTGRLVTQSGLDLQQVRKLHFHHPEEFTVGIYSIRQLLVWGINNQSTCIVTKIFDFVSFSKKDIWKSWYFKSKNFFLPDNRAPFIFIFVSTYNFFFPSGINFVLASNRNM